VIVADTGAVVALVDADDRHHRALQELFEADPSQWVIPWAALPEIDYLLATHVGAKAQDAFLADLPNQSPGPGKPASALAARRPRPLHFSHRSRVTNQPSALRPWAASSRPAPQARRVLRQERAWRA
jgi:predicted nucleic acid-binding protein